MDRSVDPQTDKVEISDSNSDAEHLVVQPGTI